MVSRLAKWSFLLLVFSLPFFRPLNFTIAGTRVPATDIIFVVTALLTAIAILRGELRLRYDRAFIGVVIYGAVLAVTAFFPEASVFKLIGEYYLFALCFLTFLHCGDIDFQQQVVITWVTATVLSCAFSLVGIAMFYAGWTTQEENYFLSHVGSLPAGNYPRVQSLFANPNMLCNYLNISIPLIWYAAKKAWVGKAVTIAAAIVSLVAALFTISPGLGGIAISLGLIGYAFGSGRKRRMIAVAPGILVALVVLGLTLVTSDTENTSQEVRLPFVQKRMEPSVRVLAWQDVVARVSESPLLGRGIGSRPAELKYQTLSGEKQLLTDAHNVYLDVLGQAGIIGLASFLLLIILIAWRKWSNDLVIVLGCAFVGTVLYQGLTGSYEDARHVWVLIGMILAASRVKAAENDASPASTEP
jgi:putative inorganic carbon (hco3(-)) transporter